jgi:hypothetical protein
MTAVKLILVSVAVVFAAGVATGVRVHAALYPPPIERAAETVRKCQTVLFNGEPLQACQTDYADSDDGVDFTVWDLPEQQPPTAFAGWDLPTTPQQRRAGLWLDELARLTARGHDGSVVAMAVYYGRF